MKKVQLTKEGFDLLTAELKDLMEAKQPIVVEKLQKARAMGDLAENNAYNAAREELALVEGRIQELQEILKYAEIYRTNGDKNTIEIGAHVTIEIENNQDEFHIVGEYEADPMNKKLSHTSPIGMALMGKKVGESVTIDIPSGRIVYKIVEIK